MFAHPGKRRRGAPEGERVIARRAADPHPDPPPDFCCWARDKRGPVGEGTGERGGHGWMRLLALHSLFFVAHDLGPKTGRHFSGSCAVEARLLDGLSENGLAEAASSFSFAQNSDASRAARTDLLFTAPRWAAGEREF